MYSTILYSRRMFEAMRQLTDHKKTADIYVNDSDGNKVGNDQLKADLLKEYFEEQFNNGDEPLQPFACNPKPLDKPM